MFGVSSPDADLVLQVSFLTAALMAVALCFHSVLEVRPRCEMSGMSDKARRGLDFADSELAQGHTPFMPGRLDEQGGTYMKQLLQGMAMGAQVNIVDSVHIFIAIAAHKGLAAYALGSSVVDSQARPYRAVLQWHAECCRVPSVGLAFVACVCTP